MRIYIEVRYVYVYIHLNFVINSYSKPIQFKCVAARLTLGVLEVLKVGISLKYVFVVKTSKTYFETERLGIFISILIPDAQIPQATGVAAA